MAYEVDFLDVGDAGKSGDAIALRVGNLAIPSEQGVVVIDGGFQPSGETLVKHIRDYYKTNRVDLIVSTHPDGDHNSGLTAVLEQMDVKQLWMHKPWEHTDGTADLFRNGRVTDAGVRASLRRSLEDAVDLESLARSKSIPIVEPFAGYQAEGFGATFTVLGPSREYYESLLPGFRSTPAPAQSTGLFQRALQGAQEVVQRVAEDWGYETLADDGETSPENNSSVILLVSFGDDLLLFTGDAGIPALTAAADQLEASGFAAANIKFIQVPHHGSKRNVGPTVLNRLLGPKLATDERLRTAFVSAAQDAAPKHPAKKVLNAFRRRGAPVHGTDDGNARWHHSTDAPARTWGPSTPHPFYSEVDD